MRLILFAAGMLIASDAMAQETTTYTYDALGRLRTSSTSGGPNTNTNTQIDLDPAGNRTRYQVTGAPNNPPSGQKVVVVPLNGFTVIPIPNPWAAR